MRLFYYRSRKGNFGDDLNGWLWERLAPDQWSDSDDTLFYGIGTIIGNPAPPAARSIIFSSGFGYSAVPADWRNGSWNVAAVRGHLTASMLDLPPDAAVADGALLLRKLPEMTPLSDGERKGVVFVPHHSSLEFGGWQQACTAAGVDLVDPRDDSMSVIGRLRTAKLVLAESMHAAIIADAMRTPWIPMASSNQVSTFKWLDWASALNVPVEFARIAPPSAAAAYDSLAFDRACGSEFTLPATPQAAVAHLRDRRRRLAPRWERLLRRGPIRIMKSPFARDLVQKVDERRQASTAARLAELAGRRGYLSDQSILQARIDELWQRFSEVIRKEGRV